MREKEDKATGKGQKEGEQSRKRSPKIIKDATFHIPQFCLLNIIFIVYGALSQLSHSTRVSPFPKKVSM